MGRLVTLQILTSSSLFLVEEARLKKKRKKNYASSK